jgi:nitrite reductase/ring-hydroxylating ferredoxin subunit/uncharacterized membrane protein
MAEPIADRIIRRQSWLEVPANILQKVVGGSYRVLGRPGQLVRDVLHGTKPLGHPLHPAITDIPIGAWTVVFLLDVAAHFWHNVPAQAIEFTLAIGVAGALIAVLSGLTDYQDTFGHERRVATAHGLTMVAVLILEAVSLVLRLWAGPHAHGAAVVLSAIGLLLLGAGGYLGGHLVFAMGTMVNRNAFAEGPSEFIDVGEAELFAEGRCARVQAEDIPVLVLRLGGTLRAIGAVCSHAGGPLDEGALEGGVVTCPWHGSRFRVNDGQVLRGPATFNQPVLVAEERNGRVWLKRT